MNGDEGEVAWIDFRDQQRHVGFHAMIARIGNNEVARGRERAFNVRGDGGVHGGKQKLRRISGLRFADHNFRGRERHITIQTPSCRIL